MAKRTVAKKADSKDKKKGPPPKPTSPISKMKLGATKMPERRKPVADNRDKPEAQLGMARAALTRVQAELGRQMSFRENNNWDCEAPGGIYDRLEALTKIFDEKGLTEPRDLSHNWLGFREEVNQIGNEIPISVADHLEQKAGRMLWTGRLTDEQATKLWAEAEGEGEKPHDKIRGFSHLINNLRVAGCIDPEEQELRGGHQTGGNRRRRTPCGEKDSHFPRSLILENTTFYYRLSNQFLYVKISFMKSYLRYFLIVFGILLVTAGIAAFFDSSLQSPPTIALSEVVTKINAGNIKELDVKGDTIQVIATNGDKSLTNKETTISAFETLANLGADKTKLSAIKIQVQEPSGFESLLAGILPTILTFGFIWFVFWLMFRQAQKGSGQAMSFGKSKAQLADTSNGNRKPVTFNDVAGLIEAKTEVAEVVEFLKDPKKFQKLGARIPRGVLLVGSPGTGKTLLARAVANEAHVPFYYVSGSEFVEMFVGVGANRVRDTFELAKKTAPSIIFIDEIDAVGRHRGAGLGGGHDEREQTLNQILVEMDGFDTNNAVIVMGATNRPDILDPALLRPGRFDRRVILDEPSLKDREAILKIHSLDKPLAKNVNLVPVAERTVGFSGAELANLLNEAAILAARADQTEITQDNIMEAIEKVILGPERRSHILSKKEKEITAYHEAGHALVASSLPHSDKVHKVSIVSRGRAGGFTMKVPSEDKYLKSKPEFESELAVLLAGYAAEKLIFKQVTTGASSDLKVASELARRMITQYGMSDALGPVSFHEKDDLVFLGKDLSSAKSYSETIAYQIDTEIKKFITKGLDSAKKILSKHIDKLNLVAKELIKKETLEQKEFYALVR